MLGIPLVVASLLLATSAAPENCAGTWWVNQAPVKYGEVFPEFGFSSCQGGSQTTRDLEGQPVLINFWATWCNPCVKEIPNFAKLVEQAGDGVQVLGVSVDSEREAVRKFVSRRSLPYTIAWDSAGIASDIGVSSIPLTVALDATGRVVGAHRGYASLEDLEALLRLATETASK